MSTDLSSTFRTVLLLALSIFVFTASASAGERLKLATTTSTDNSGLLNVLNPPFEKKRGVSVDVIAVGTGRALALGRGGDTDVLLVHAPEAEITFVEEGYGVDRREVMYNDFVILGPVEDPAGISGWDNAAAALQKIARTKAFFVSRGDDSGTHKKELFLWRTNGIDPGGDWYLSVGQGMGASLQIAEEKKAYILADRGTFLAYRNRLELAVIVEGDDSLLNPYGVMAVNPDRWPEVNAALARAYIEWLVSPEGRKIIREFTVNGEVLFHPAGE